MHRAVRSWFWLLWDRDFCREYRWNKSIPDACRRATNPASLASALSTHLGLLPAHSSCPVRSGCYSPMNARWAGIEGSSMIRYVVSTTGAALLLATSVYAQEAPPLLAAAGGTFAPPAVPTRFGWCQG